METRRCVHRHVRFSSREYDNVSAVKHVSPKFREQVEKAYAQLTEYYSQLQAAYNVIYSQLKQIEAERAAAESAQQVGGPLSAYSSVNLRKTVSGVHF